MTDASPARAVRERTDPVQSVARALEMLDVLQHQEYVTISELAELHGVHRATTLRLLQTLEKFGYVVRGRTRGEFQLGIKMYEMGTIFADRFTLLKAARPMMRHLAQQTGETIDLALYDGGEILLIESVAARPTGRVGSVVGRRSATTCTTTGKLYFASLPTHEMVREIELRGLQRIGPKSITDRDQFFAEIDRVKTNGYAVNDEETDANVRFVGVPIDLPDSRHRPGLILGAPAHRLAPTSIPGVARMLTEAARRIADVA